MDKGVDLNVKTNEGRTLLHVATLRGMTDLVQKIIELGGDVNTADNDGMTPLMKSIWSDSREVFYLLLSSKGIEIDAIDNKGKSALHYAVVEVNRTLIEELLNKGASMSLKNNMGTSPIDEAMYDDNIDTVMIFIRNGMDVNTTNGSRNTALHIAVLSESLEEVAELMDLNADMSIRNKDGDSPLTSAIMIKNIDMLNILLKGEILTKPVSIRDETMLQLMVDEGELEVVKKLVEMGGDLTIPHPSGETSLSITLRDKDVDMGVFIVKHTKQGIDSVDENKNTLLHLAAEILDTDNIKLLLEMGANFRLENTSGDTAITIATRKAIEKDSLDYITFLIDYGVDINIIDGKGNSFIHYAAKDDNELLDKLIKMGADVTVINKIGQNPMNIATVHKNRQGIVKLMRASNKVKRKIDVITQKSIKEEYGDGTIDLVKLRKLLKEGGSAEDVDFKDEHIMHLVGTDHKLEEMHVDEYLKDDPLNFVVLERNNVFFANLRRLDQNLVKGTLLECIIIDGDNRGPSNVKTLDEMFNARHMAAIFGYIPMSSMKRAMEHIHAQTVRVFRLSKPIRHMGSAVSRDIFDDQADITSGLHCQEGTGGQLKSMIPVFLSNLPFSGLPEPLDIQMDVELLINLRVIMEKSSVKSRYTKAMENIIKDHVYTSSPIQKEKRKNQLEHSMLMITTPDHIKTIHDACRVFKPEIKIVTFFYDMPDVSFISYIIGLEKFISRRVRSRQVLSVLNTHKDTIVNISMPMERHIESLSQFTKLKRVKTSGFDRFDKVFQALSKVVTLEYLELQSNDVFDQVFSEEDLMTMDPPPPAPSFPLLANLVNLKTLKLSFNRFVGPDIEFLSSLTKLENLTLHLPMYSGSMVPVSNLKNIVHQSIHTGNPIINNVV